MVLNASVTGAHVLDLIVVVESTALSLITPLLMMSETVLTVEALSAEVWLVVVIVGLVSPPIAETHVLGKPVPHILVLLVSASDSLIHTFTRVVILGAMEALKLRGSLCSITF